MCVIRDRKVRQLEFLSRFYQNMPAKLQQMVEESAELFLYTKGIVPVVGMRRGKRFHLLEFEQHRKPAKAFAPPPGFEPGTQDDHLRTSFAEAIYGASR